MYIQFKFYFILNLWYNLNIPQIKYILRRKRRIQLMTKQTKWFELFMQSCYELLDFMDDPEEDEIVIIGGLEVINLN